MAKSTPVVEAAQPKLLEIKLTPAHKDAERYAEIWDDIENRKDLLAVQAEKVIVEMEKQNMRELAVRDSAGLLHKFEIKSGPKKLKHSQVNPQ